MRITLNQEEIFEAIGGYLRGKMNLDTTASIEISLTAGRGPKGYTADVDISYPKSEMAGKIVAAQRTDDAEETSDSTTSAQAETAADATTPADQGAKSSGDIFN